MLHSYQPDPRSFAAAFGALFGRGWAECRKSDKAWTRLRLAFGWLFTALGEVQALRTVSLPLAPYLPGCFCTGRMQRGGTGTMSPLDRL